MARSVSADMKYLREDKDLPEKPKMTENLEEKYPDKKKPFPEYTSSKRNPSVKEGLQYLANEKTAGGLFDRVQKQQGDAQQVSGLLNSAIGKFRSLVFEVSGTEKIIEIDKTGETINMKVFEDKDSPTPSSEKKFKMPEFLNFFMQKLAPRNSQQVAQELSNKGIAEVNKGTFISVKVAMKKKSWVEDESLVENREYSYLEPLKIYNEYTDGALQVEETSPMYFKLLLKGKVITEGDDIDITKRIEQMNRERGFM